jgi:hypothetical protein
MWKGNPYFHMKEMANPNGPFKKWFRQKRTAPSLSATGSDGRSGHHPKNDFLLARTIFIVRLPREENDTVYRPTLS